MSRSRRLHAVKVLKAISSTVRLRILNLLFNNGPLSYTELMSSLRMNPSRDAGRFAYHLKFLLKTDLIEADVEAKKYRLTELGNVVIDVAEEIERKASKRKKMLVRTSRFALEEFDANKIAGSLITEAKMPVELAQKVAKNAEKRLLKSKTKYLTAPLVREVVNAILIEKGLEEYRHKLTRLGLPVHDVAVLVETKSKKAQGSASVHETAGKTVLEEYTLLHMLPRDIADLHLSGSLDINDLGCWILKPREIFHDLRFFLQKGRNVEKLKVSTPIPYQSPRNFEHALSTVLDVLLHSVKEVSVMQTLDYFNVFLSPFVKGMKTQDVKKALRLFIFNVNQHVNVSLGLELVTPDFLAQKSVFNPSGKLLGTYGNFSEKSQLLALLLLEIFAEESTRKPLFNPKIVIKTRLEAFKDEKAKALFLEAHGLASEKGVPYFANVLGKKRKRSVFSASGCKLEANLKGDWEIDTLRTSNMGCVTVNLPRITCECGRDRTKFFEILWERLEMAARALAIKYRALKRHGGGLLPFLMQSIDGDQYFRLENSSHLINLVGLKEAVEGFYEVDIRKDEKVLEFATEIMRSVSDFTRKVGKRRGIRLLPSVLPSVEAAERLAQLDIERYGVAKVRFSGTREKPFYSTATRLTLHDGKVLPESLKLEQRLREMCAGGNLLIIALEKGEYKPEDLAALTKQVVEKYSIDFMTYDRSLTYCVNCNRSWFGPLQKCPLCGAVSTLTAFSKVSE